MVFSEKTESEHSWSYWGRFTMHKSAVLSCDVNIGNLPILHRPLLPTLKVDSFECVEDFGVAKTG